MQKKKRILIVEDEESLLKLETVLLTVKGFEVVAAFTGAMALEILARETFDLVLLDIMLPDIDGFEVCRKIRSDPRSSRIPIIMLTARKSQADQDQGTLCGANSYLIKPFKSARIIEEINRLLIPDGT
ncbi:MAG TPA: response regulator [Desulfuromonadales bacterium]|nr:response regulator [Desulfuromonadales bacterium]